MRDLDFSPFNAAIDAVNASTMASLDQLTTNATIADLHSAIKQGVITSRVLTLLYLSRIRQFDSKLHSITELNPDALSEAKKLDELTNKSFDKGVLHGIPILLKDNIATGDRLHNTAGALVLRDHRATKDALLVEQLRNAGALILGKASMSEWAFAMSWKAPSGYSALGGQVINPFGAGLEVAGSSTGSAVAVAARFATAAIGTETTGSIIAPSSFNGVCGMRPSTGLISSKRIIPVSSALDTAGPITTNVSDLATLLSIMARAEEIDSKLSALQNHLAKNYTDSLGSIPLSGLRIGIVAGDSLGYSGNDESMLASVVRYCKDAGCRVVESPITDEQAAVLLDSRTDMLFADMRRGINAYLTQNNAPVDSLASIMDFNNAEPKTRMPYSQDLLVKAQNSALSDTEYRAMAESAYAAALLIIRNAANIAQADFLLSLDNHFSYFYSAAGVPAVTVPIGFDSDGQPHGATFVGIDRNRDAEVLAVAYAFEKSTKLRETPDLNVL